MSKSITISGSKYTVTGVVKDKQGNGALDVRVIAYYKKAKQTSKQEDYFLGIAVTNKMGVFNIHFDSSKFKSLFSRTLDLYLVVQDGGYKFDVEGDDFIKNATESAPPINLSIDLSKSKLRGLINNTPAEGWVGGFYESNPEFAYPNLDFLINKDEKLRNNHKYAFLNPDLSSLGDLKDNLVNIDKLHRQQKVVWAEFSWNTKPCSDDKKRCFTMFAPDISRLGYDKTGRVYSIVCPQQGTYIKYLGSMNVEITVTGNRGWVKESDRTAAADMGVEAKIWFSQKAKEGFLLRPLVTRIEKRLLGNEYALFPSTKEKAIRINTFKAGFPDQSVFSLMKGQCDDFKIPEFAKHEEISWTVGHLGVQIGTVVKTGCSKIDKFNQTIVDLFNINSGNMLKENNVLTWNVWFTAPEKVDQTEWQEHAKKWRTSIDVDHADPNGPGTVPRYFDGTVFKRPVFSLILKLLQIIYYIIKRYMSMTVVPILLTLLLLNRGNKNQDE